MQQCERWLSDRVNTLGFLPGAQIGHVCRAKATMVPLVPSHSQRCTDPGRGWGESYRWALSRA
jgi:hypothetical protein